MTAGSRPPADATVVAFPVPARVTAQAPETPEEARDRLQGEVAGLGRELAVAHRVIWLMAARSGGEFTFPAAELDLTPPRPWITIIPAAGGGWTVRAR